MDAGFFKHLCTCKYFLISKKLSWKSIVTIFLLNTVQPSCKIVLNCYRVDSIFSSV